MAILEAKDLVIRTRTIDEGSRGTFLEIAFEGVHTHHWPDGSNVQAFVEGEIRAAAPAACLFDFLRYEYSFGDEIAGPVLRPMLDSIPVAVVARGRTEPSSSGVLSLKGLFAAMMLDKLPDYGLFEDAASGYAFLRDRVDRRAKRPSPG